jgi:predicted  nucleic acid-binding Zn-ribbon protein
LVQLPGVIIKHKKIGAEFDPDDPTGGGGEEDTREPKMTLKKLAEIVIEGFKKQNEFNNYIKNEVEELKTEMKEVKADVQELKTDVQELKAAQKKTDEKLNRVIELNNLKS